MKCERVFPIFNSVCHLFNNLSFQRVSNFSGMTFVKKMTLAPGVPGPFQNKFLALLETLVSFLI